MILKDKVAIVTGGGSGIGKGIALGFAKEGAHLVIAARGFDRLKETAKEIESLGRKALPIKVDVSRSNEVNEMVKQTMREFGKIDILVNNAGIFPQNDFLEMPEEEMDLVFSINLKGPFLCTQAVAREMVKRNSGSIINIASTMALLGLPRNAHYTATKGALVSVTRAWAKELSHLGINVNVVVPGVIATQTLNETFPPEMIKGIAEISPVRRLGTPEDLVGICVLLASEGGSYITGATMCVDGGFSEVFLI